MNFVLKEQDNMNSKKEMRIPEGLATDFKQKPPEIKGFGIKTKACDKNLELQQQLMQPVHKRSTFHNSTSSSYDCSDDESSCRKQTISGIKDEVTTARKLHKTHRGGTCNHDDQMEEVERQTCVVSKDEEDEESDEGEEYEESDEAEEDEKTDEEDEDEEYEGSDEDEESDEDDEETDESYQGKEDLGDENEEGIEGRFSAVDSDDSVVFERQVSDQNQPQCSAVGNIQSEIQKFIDICARYHNGKRSNAKAVGLYKKGARERAIHEFKWAAKHCHNISAYYHLGLCFTEKEDFVKAIRYYKVAAEEGHAKANYNIACIVLKYRTKLTTKHSESDGIMFLERAAVLGLKQAQTEFGIILMEKTDTERAVQFFELAAIQEYPRAIYGLGICYERGLGVEVNHAKAADLYRRASIGQYPEAQHNLGVFFERGLGGLTENKEEAAKWYKEAVKNGHQKSADDVERLKRIDASKDKMTVAVEYYARDEHPAFQDTPSISKGEGVSIKLPLGSQVDVEDVMPSVDMD